MANRYEIALGVGAEVIKSKKDNKICYRYPVTYNSNTIKNYMKHCINKKGCFKADNLPLSAVNSAVIRISKEYNLSIIMPNEVEARAFSMSYSYSKVFSINKMGRIKEAIFYNCCETDDVKSILTIIK